MENTPESEQAYPFWASRQRFLEKPQVKIVRPSNRRKFLVGLLGGAAVLGLGAASMVQALQSLRVAQHVREFPYNDYKSALGLAYASDLSLCAFYDWEEHGNPRERLLIWDYEQQRASALLTGPVAYLASWSPDSRLLVCLREVTKVISVLDIWDIWTRQRLGSYQDGDGSASIDAIAWSPDSTRIALLIQQRMMMLSAPQMQPLFTLQIPTNASVLAWSPDGNRLALVIEAQSTSGYLQIWNLQTRQTEASVSFSGHGNNLRSTLAWSPDGRRIAAILYGQCRMIHVAERLSITLLGESAQSGALAWSPDSRYLALSLQRPSPSISGEFCVWDIVRMTKARVILSDGSSVPDEIAWSKDGQFIVSILGLYTRVSWPWP